MYFYAESTKNKENTDILGFFYKENKRKRDRLRFRTLYCKENKSRYQFLKETPFVIPTKTEIHRKEENIYIFLRGKLYDQGRKENADNQINKINRIFS